MSNQPNHIEENKRILALAEKLSMPDTKSKNIVWPLVASQLTMKGQVILMSTWLKMAASVALVFISGYFLYVAQYVEVSTARAQQSEITLPDGSIVSLNAQSCIGYNRLSWRIERKLHFEGEGFFQVKKGSKFSVYSKSGITQVLGTSFNIYARGNEYKVSCTSGKVQVKFANNNLQLLTPGLETSNSTGAFDPKRFEEIKTLAWQKGEFYFESALLKDVFKTIERQYNISLDYQNIDEYRRYTGFFTNRDIDETLKVVCLPMGLNYTLIDAKNIKIFKEQNV